MLCGPDHVRQSITNTVEICSKECVYLVARWGRLGDWRRQAVEQAPLSGAVAGPDAVLGVHPLPLPRWPF